MQIILCNGNGRFFLLRFVPKRFCEVEDIQTVESMFSQTVVNRIQGLSITNNQLTTNNYQSNIQPDLPLIRRLANYPYLRPMFIETRYLKPHIGSFFKYLIFGLVPFLTVAILVYLYTTANPLKFSIESWFSILLLIPVLTAIILAPAARQAELHIAESDDLKTINQWVQEQFLVKDHRISPDGGRETILQSKKFYDRWFGSWFGSELITLLQKDEIIIIKGPQQLLKMIDEELRFENLRFEDD